MHASNHSATTNPAGGLKIMKDDYGHDDEKTAFESFEDLTSKLLRVSKEEVNERRIERKEARKRKQD